MQQHAANSSQQFAPRFSGAAIHTPTQSFSEALQTPDSQGMNWAGNTSVKEEELAKSRLSDAHFNIRNYEDPLLPRRDATSRYYPKGVTADMEKRLLDLVAKIKAGNA